jgi:hypothetical protein
LKIIDGKIDAFVVDTVRPIAGSLLVETIPGGRLGSCAQGEGHQGQLNTLRNCLKVTLE